MVFKKSFIIGISCLFFLVGCTPNEKEKKINNDNDIIITQTKSENKENDITNKNISNINDFILEICNKYDMDKLSYVDKTILTDIYDVNVDNIDDFGGFISDNSKAEELLILKINNKEKIDSIRESLQNRKNNQLTAFKEIKNESQVEILKNSNILIINDYIVFICLNKDIQNDVIKDINNYISKE